MSDDSMEMVWSIGLQDKASAEMARLTRLAEQLQARFEAAFKGIADWRDVIDSALGALGKHFDNLGMSEEKASKLLNDIGTALERFVNDAAPTADTMAAVATALHDAGLSGDEFVKCLSPVTAAMKTLWEPTDKAAEVFGAFKERLDALGVPLELYAKDLEGLQKRLDEFTRSGKGANEILEGTKSLLSDIGISDKAVGGVMEPITGLVNADAEQAKRAADELKRLQAEQDKAAASARRLERQTQTSMSRVQRAIYLATNVASGNFYSLARALTLCADKFKVIGLSAGVVSGIGAIGAAVAGVVMLFNKWKKSIEEAKKKLDAVREADFLAHLKQMKEVQGELAEEMTKTVSAIDKALERDQQELTLTRERIKAQIELNRQRALEGKSGEEAERISREYDSQLAAIDRQASDHQIALQIEAAQAKTDALYALLEKYEGVERKFTDVVTSGGRTFTVNEGEALNLLEGESVVSAKGGTRRVGGLLETLQANFDTANGDEARIFNRHLNEIVEKKLEAHLRRIADLQNAPIPNTAEARAGREAAIEQAKRDMELARRDALQRVPASADFKTELREDADYQRAKKRVAELKAQLEAAQAARDKVREAIADSEDREDSLQKTQEIEGRKAEIAIEVEERKQERIKAIREAAERQGEMRLLAAQHASLVAEGNDAASRLADAQQQVATAWGWYRDRDSLRAQIAEWEVDAAARKQYEEDYHSLVHGRNAERFSELKDLQQRGHYDKLEEQMGEWRRKKLISVDDEATMRVALAKDEEKRAQKALDEINEATRNAAASLAAIESAITEGGD